MKKLIGTFLTLSLLSACATPYQPVPFDRATTQLTDIQVVDDALPQKADVRKFATNGGNIAGATSGAGVAGLAVALVAAGVEANIAAGQRAKIQAALEKQHFDAEKVFDEALEAALKSQNYNVSTNPAKHESGKTFVVVPAQPNAEATAVLDVKGDAYGYQLAGNGTMWRPFVVLQVHMVDAKDPTKVLMDNKIEYNAVTPVPLTVSIPGDDEYGFAKIDDIEANPEKAAEGLKKALVAAANSTAQLLKQFAP